MSSSYSFSTHLPDGNSVYLWPTVERVLQEHFRTGRARRVFDLGCGNGAFAHRMSELGIEVTGIDPSETGIALARSQYPALNLKNGSAYDDLTGFGTFSAVVSLEVVEHLYSPRLFAHAVHRLLEPEGIAVISTPYHGYIKDLCLALAGRMDSQYTALWDHGHIKFFSVRTLSQLLSDEGLRVDEVYRVGRIPVLAKSMIVVARKSAEGR